MNDRLRHTPRPDDRNPVEPPAPTRISIVGTLAEFRHDPVPYDLAELVRFVRAIDPDLLCLDMTLDEWHRRDFGGLPPEYRDALLPLAAQSDIVVVPIGDSAQPQDRVGETAAAAGGVRVWLYDRLRRIVAGVQRGTHDPAAANQGIRHALAEVLFYLIDHVRGGGARAHAARHRDELVGRILNVANRDPGRRILVVVNARHCHQLRAALRHHAGVHLVSYTEL